MPHKDGSFIFSWVVLELVAPTFGTVSHVALLAPGGGKRLSGGSGSQAGLVVSQSDSLLMTLAEELATGAYSDVQLATSFF